MNQLDLFNSLRPFAKARAVRTLFAVRLSGGDDGDALYLGHRRYTYQTGSFNPGVTFDRAKLWPRHADAKKLAEQYNGSVVAVEASL